MLITNKFGGYPISILKNSNKILSSTEESFVGIRPGSLIKIGDSDILYPILSSKNIFYSKDFEVVNGRQIKINENTEINIQKEDSIKIIYDEYELNYIINILNEGNYYKVNDVLTVKGGELSINISDGMGEPTQFVVEEIGEAGTIKKLSLKSKGRYISFPSEKVELYGGAGQNCSLELKYKIIDNRNVEEKIVKNIEFKDNQTILTLDYSLPLNLQNGRISLEKSELTLGVNYLGQTKLNESYRLIKDFSNNYSFPFTVKNNDNFHLIFNEFVNRMDSKIKELEDKIKNLQKF